MRVCTAHAVEKFIADRFAGNRCAGVEDLLHRRTIASGGRVRCEPFRAAAAGALASDVVHILDHGNQTGEWTAFGSFDRRRDIVWNEATAIDRKSTRLNSSHLGISYAVFCLKKKKKSRDVAQ